MKRPCPRFSAGSVPVAPFAGAWIETTAQSPDFGSPAVAPFAGAWIETVVLKTSNHRACGRPLRGGVD